MSLVIRNATSSCHYKNPKRDLKLAIRSMDRSFCNKSQSSLIPFEKYPPVNYINDRIIKISEWYDRLSGLEEVKMAQDKVVKAGEKLSQCQEERRKASKSLLLVQQKLKEVYAELDITKRGDDRYLYLVTEEHKLLKEEETRRVKFQQAEDEERDQFNVLTNSVSESHEKERTQAKRTKYWSLVVSALGTAIAIIGSTMNNKYRFAELQQIIQVSTNELIKLKSHVEATETLVNNLPILNNNDFNNYSKLDGNLLDKLNKTIIKVDQCINRIENINKNDRINEMKEIIDKMEINGPEAKIYSLQFSSLEKSIEKRNREVITYIVSLSILCILTPIILKMC